jgi:hypothetical protein
LLEALVTSKTRLKLLLKFFLNPENSAYLRGLESEFDESSNAIRLELNRLKQANMLKSEMKGNRKLFQVNQKHPLYKEINSIVRKYFGLDIIIENIANRLGDLEMIMLTGDIAKGRDTGIIDILLVGDIDREYLVKLVQKAEVLIKRKIRFLIYTFAEWEALPDKGGFLIWSLNGANS